MRDMKLESDDLQMLGYVPFRFQFLLHSEVEVTTAYTYLRVQYSRPRFGLRQAPQPHMNKGCGSLALSDTSGSQHHLGTSRPN